ncbi:MAG: hypothetical protein LBJ77_02710 [Holosporales bacterium]|nr:hypothetical protein [Holosporales bacterium]
MTDTGLVRVPSWVDASLASDLPGRSVPKLNSEDTDPASLIHLTGDKIGDWWSSTFHITSNLFVWSFVQGWLGARSRYLRGCVLPVFSMTQYWGGKQDRLSILFPSLDRWDANTALTKLGTTEVYDYWDHIAGNASNLFNSMVDTLSGLGETFASLKEEGIIPEDIGDTLTPESLEALAVHSGNSGSPENMSLIDDLQGTLRKWKMMCLGAVTGGFALGTGLWYLQKSMHQNTRVKRILGI